jgi:hypothetical protein
MSPYTALKAAETFKKGGAGAAPTQEGGLAPMTGAQDSQAFKKVDMQFLKANDLIEALVEKHLATRAVSERTGQIVRYAVGLEYLVDTEDKDVEMALRIIQQVIADLKDIAQDSLRFTKRIIEQLKWAKILPEVSE